MRYVRICLIILFFICNLKVVFASEIFSDNFDLSDDFSNWQLNVNPSSWNIHNGVLRAEISSGENGLLISKFCNIPSIYDLSLDLRNLNGIDQHVVFNSNGSGTRFYLIELRYLDDDYKVDGGTYRVWKYTDTEGWDNFIQDVTFAGVQNDWHKLKINLDENNVYSISVDGDVIYSFPNSLSGDEKCFGFHNHGGAFNSGMIINEYDNLVVSSGDEQNLVIILPGLGASWNEQSMVLNNDQGEWRMTPFVKNYDQLIKYLSDNGVEYKVWNYDWRKNIDQIVNDFNSYFSSLDLSNKKIYLVGHSLGGVVAEEWQVKYGNSFDGQIITLGSPLQGSVKAYRAWEGAEFGKINEMGNVAMNVLLQLNKRFSENKVQIVRRYSPIFRDLIPTFSFLTKNGLQLSTRSNYDPNNYLKDGYGGTKIVGVGSLTESKLNLRNSNWWDNYLNQWRDGRIETTEKTDGDGTVVKYSGVELISDHGSIPDKSINYIGQLLGVGNTVTYSSNDYEFNNVFYVGSPASYTIICNGKIVGTSNDFLVNDDNLEGCKLELVGTGVGQYHLVYGIDGEWGSEFGNIKTNEKNVFTITSKRLINVQITDKSIKELFGILSSKYKSKYLKLAKLAYEFGDYRTTMMMMSGFRIETNENNLSYEIMESLSDRLASREKLNKETLIKKIDKLLETKVIKPTEYNAVNYQRLLSIETGTKGKNLLLTLLSTEMLVK